MGARFNVCFFFNYELGARVNENVTRFSLLDADFTLLSRLLVTMSQFSLYLVGFSFKAWLVFLKC